MYIKNKKNDYIINKIIPLRLTNRFRKNYNLRNIKSNKEYINNKINKLDDKKNISYLSLLKNFLLSKELNLLFISLINRNKNSNSTLNLFNDDYVSLVNNFLNNKFIMDKLKDKKIEELLNNIDLEQFFVNKDLVV